MSGKSTGLMGWARPEAGFASGRGGDKQLPLQSKTNADPSARIFTHRTGATGQYFPAMDAGPASRPPDPRKGSRKIALAASDHLIPLKALGQPKIRWFSFSQITAEDSHPTVLCDFKRLSK